MELKDKDDWVKINAGQHTLMRVLYTPEMTRRLEAGVRERTLKPEVGHKRLRYGTNNAVEPLYPVPFVLSSK